MYDYNVRDNFLFQFLSLKFHSCWEKMTMAGTYIKGIDLAILKQGLSTLNLTFYDAAVMIENTVDVLAEYNVLLLSGEDVLGLSTNPDVGVHLVDRFHQTAVSFIT